MNSSTSARLELVKAETDRDTMCGDRRQGSRAAPGPVIVDDPARLLASWLALVRRVRIVKHGARADAHAHPGVAAPDRGAGADASGARDLPALVYADAHADRADAGADSHVHAAAADADPQRHAGDDGDTDAYTGTDGGAGGQARDGAAGEEQSDGEGGSHRGMTHAFQSRRTRPHASCLPMLGRRTI